MHPSYLVLVFKEMHAMGKHNDHEINLVLFVHALKIVCNGVVVVTRGRVLLWFVVGIWNFRTISVQMPTYWWYGRAMLLSINMLPMHKCGFFFTVVGVVYKKLRLPSKTYQFIPSPTLRLIQKPIWQCSVFINGDCVWIKIKVYRVYIEH